MQLYFLYVYVSATSASVLAGGACRTSIRQTHAASKNVSVSQFD